MLLWDSPQDVHQDWTDYLLNFIRFWNIIGHDYFEVIKKCIKEAVLPLSCQRAVLTLLPKMGDLTFLKNWRPVAI